MKYKDFYSHLLKESTPQWDSSKLISHLLKNETGTFSGFLYHGTPPDGLLSMLTEGIYGQEHGEVAEYEAFSTSTNPEVLRLFAEMKGETGLTFKVKNINVLVIDDILGHLVTREGGSGMSFDFDEDEYEKFCVEYNIPRDNRDYYLPYYLPYNFISSIDGIDAWCHKYAWGRINNPRGNDESEICFVGKSTSKLDPTIYDITIDGDVYDISEKQEAIERLKSEIE